MKYEYKHLEQGDLESDKDLLLRVNELGKDGWRFIYESMADGGPARVLLERCYE